MQYVDTSLLVAALLNEKGTAVAQRWLGDQPAGELAVSDWVITEFSAALSMKLRTGELEPPQRNEVLAFFTRLTDTLGISVRYRSGMGLSGISGTWASETTPVHNSNRTTNSLRINVLLSPWASRSISGSTGRTREWQTATGTAATSASFLW